MKARDLAWLTSVAEDSSLIYDRKDEVVSELQALYRQAKKREIPTVNLEVKTAWAEQQEKEKDG